jgi:hypothetical protein
MKSTAFWDITTCIPLKVNRLFGRIYRLHLQDRIIRTRYQREGTRQAVLNRYYLGIYLELLKKPAITSVRRAGGPAKIRT